MILDSDTVLAVTGLVVVVSGSLFVIETLLRRDEGAGRIWALAFLSAMLTVLSYVIWLQDRDAWWAIAIGNAGFVAANGCMWLGCAAYNGRRLQWRSIVVAVLSAAALVAVAIEGPGGGDWAGALWMFLGVVVLAALGALECVRGALGETRTATVLAVVLGVEALYFVARTVAILLAGPESGLFQSAFGSVPTSLVTIVLCIVAVVVASVLRVPRAPMRGVSERSEMDRNGVLTAAAFTQQLTDVLGRAQQRRETVAVTAVRIADLDEVSTAFGGDAAREVAGALRQAVRAHVPSDALVCDDDAAGMLVATVVDSGRDAHRGASRLHRGLFDDLSAAAGGVIPVVGVGVATTDDYAFDAGDLTAIARSAAVRASSSVEDSFSAGEMD